jgi:hypothetical protein
MPWPSRENDHVWKDPQHARQDLQHAWVKHAWKDPQHVWKDLQHAWIDLQIAIRSDRNRRPPNENMTALADELVSSKYRFTPLRDPTSAASVTRNSNARIPPCEDGVDPFATTAGAANDDSTADENG